MALRDQKLVIVPYYLHDLTVASTGSSRQISNGLLTTAAQMNNCTGLATNAFKLLQNDCAARCGAHLIDGAQFERSTGHTTI